jgi:transcriptional regulator with XRE-family HTH domain
MIPLTMNRETPPVGRWRWRTAAGLTQAEVGARLGRHQPFVSEVEAGQRRLSVVELMDFAEAIGFDPHETIERMKE